MKSDCHKLKETVKKLKEEHEFRGLLHYTDFSNLSSIIEIGYLCSRALCYANNIEFTDVWDKDIKAANDLKNCTRFYYEKKCNSRLNMDVPVCLVFSEELICFDLSVFTDGDADSIYTKFGTDNEFFSKKIDWETVFNIEPDDNLSENMKTSRRKKMAELIIDEPVSIRNLKNIVFRSIADYKRACILFGKNKYYSVEPEMFFNEKNFIKDYNIVYDGKIDSNVFVLHFSTNQPVQESGNNEYILYDLEGNIIRSTKIKFPESSSVDFNLEVMKTEVPVRFEFWFGGILSIEETIG
ncbi:DarT ssDNA thymidine ADP-ribosyltransferase family protein [Sedimentibacter sp. B4]|uniref:DarT ssDNA thymidine ADP-ribosyltransferase family protein n=1 Tax=Sedimentibacter sp. B4 TaxID=304766 RepID=UPI000311C2AF|nr:DarT ssDNA thymidine ADP-ribosyltransferase family protein [Sedimentibacter sp. B4]